MCLSRCEAGLQHKTRRAAVAGLSVMAEWRHRASPDATTVRAELGEKSGFA